MDPVANLSAVEEAPSEDVNRERMDDLREKEATPGPSKYELQQNTQRKSHTFKFHFRNNTYAVTCDTSMTVLEALTTNNIFRNIKKMNTEKEIVIQRSRGEVPRAAVKSDFPCCLIEKDEVLKIKFISNSGNASTEQKPTVENVSKPETLVTFYIHTTGGQKIRRLMKNFDLRQSVDDVCVYAFKEENCKIALKRDGRFINDIFKKNYVLCEMDSETIYEMSNTVEYFDQKHFQIIFNSDNDQSGDLEDFAKTSDADVPESVSQSLNPTKNKLENKKRKYPSPSTECYVLKTIEKSQEILQILRLQNENWWMASMQQKTKSQIQEFFRVEFGKSVQSFSEVKKVKQIMKRSNSVCQIRKGGSSEGTGFLLLGRFILTNAHVVGIYTDQTEANFAEFTAVFDFEDLNSQNCIQIKQLTAFCYGKDSEGRYLDYALLELDTETIFDYPALLDCYRPNAPINRGQICIVGHPGGGVKKMDPCFIIERENRIEAANKHASENQHLIHAMNEKCLEEKWNFSACENQITYNSCFFDKSSGSPVFDVDCNLIGIHTGGYKYKTEGDQTWSVMEYGFSMQPILDNIKARARIKGLKEIVSVIEAYTNVSQQNQNDVEMENAEVSDEL
ncbi:protein FAM111A-like isoform X1 [Carassius auratus]|uniref:Protein FAM111A-like isoform X1 n=1 Tax=Carassius auratus TaxID=7957 RepID=A0A6P6MIR1_CARAU|nr:protein FAM111A-like isoform X1 [Carassius auratus]XP_026096286.1 protein FAM111A-like isoform X1 [Carassius auratus]XP_026096287.1 protein FAM111A-like isoform X1 [Carassius auratus]XP_026096288.1 protein FAM111A-like isoform X2 [Carassius auratus]XP_026096289.1 protein FAM111A-like isoform X1 [Carassius auratus]